MTVLDFLKETGLDYELDVMCYTELPLTINGLLNVLEDAELNYWSYSIEDKDEIKDPSITVLLSDCTGAQRYFEIVETLTW